MQRRAIRLLAVGLLVVLTTPPAMAQESRTDKTYDEILLEVSDTVPEFAGVLGGGTTLKILVTAQRPGMIEELRDALDSAFGKFQFEEYTDTILIHAKYSWIQLFEWYGQLLANSGSFKGITMSDIDEKENRLTFGVVDPDSQAAVIEDEAEHLGIPGDAVAVIEMGYAQPDSSSEGPARLPGTSSLPKWLALTGILFALLIAFGLFSRVRARKRAPT
jgi:hypothetical protein